MHLHLTVLQDNVREGENPTQAVLFNPQRTEFRWNADFSAFWPIPLRWWDDASYIAYQGDCGDDGYEEDVILPPPTDTIPAPPDMPVCDTIPCPPLFEDDIPF